MVIRWDDPEIAIDWGTDKPTLSERDAAGCRLSDVHVLPECAVN